MASHPFRSWSPVAEWLGAVDNLRRAGFGPTGADPAALAGPGAAS